MSDRRVERIEDTERATASSTEGDNDHRSLQTLRLSFRQALDKKDLAEAARLAKELAEIQPTSSSAWHTAASAAFQAGDFGAARKSADEAVRLAPTTLAHRIFASKMHLRNEDPSAAMLVLTPAMEWPDRNAELYHVASQAAEGLGDDGLAIDFARKAWEMDPERSVRGLALANLLMRHERPGEAEEVLISVIQDPETASTALRILSGLYAGINALEPALARIDEALEFEPERVDFQMHRIGLLRRMGEIEAARSELEQLLQDRPDELRLKRSMVAALTQDGAHDEAMRLGAELLAAEPDNEDYIAMMQSLLHRRPLSKDVDDKGPDVASLKTGATHRRIRESSSFGTAARRTGEIIVALVLREIRTRYGRNRLSFVWALIEPLAHIGVLAVIFLVTHRTNPPLGNSYLLFYFTGVQSFLLFSHIAERAGGGILSARGLMQLPQVSPLDILLSKTIVEIFIAVFTILAIGAVLSTLGIVAFPVQLPSLLAAFALSVALGLGVGALFTVARVFGRAVDIALRAVFRMLYLTSGVFFLPENLPAWGRDILLWNPCLHIIDLWRTGYYSSYTAPFTTPFYPALMSLGFLAAGLYAIALATPILRSYR